MNVLKVGDLAPNVSMTDHRGQTFTIEEATASGPLVLYFYPKDFTLVCTKQACLFRDAHEEMSTLGARVVGVSIDSNDSHRSFATEHTLPFSLVADPGRKIAQAFDVLQLFGILTKRATFVIDRDRKIQGVFHHEFSAQKHLSDVRGVLAKLA